MSEAKHTPGPWQVSSVHAGKSGTSLCIWRNDGNEANTGYARICQHVHNPADAALIAAAPDTAAELVRVQAENARLIEAMKSILKWEEALSKPRAVAEMAVIASRALEAVQ